MKRVYYQFITAYGSRNKGIILPTALNQIRMDCRIFPRCEAASSAIGKCTFCFFANHCLFLNNTLALGFGLVLTSKLLSAGRTPSTSALTS